MDYLLIILFTIIGVIALLLILMIVSTIRRKGRWGLNFNKTPCINCGNPLPTTRVPKNLREALWGGWTCQHCNCVMDKWGKRLTRSDYDRMKIEIDPANADLFGSSGNGVLDMCIVRDPASWRGEEKADDFNLGMDFNFGDWEALFIDVLGYPGWDEYAEGDNIHELHERNRKKFQDAIPEYPMLARIFDMYEDYQFTPEELPKLREECLSVKLKTCNPRAIKALRKLILAGEEASKRGFHLLFICD